MVKYVPNMEVIFMNVEKKLTRFERARILGARAIQISMGAKPLVDIKDSLDPIDIAYEELNDSEFIDNLSSAIFKPMLDVEKRFEPTDKIKRCDD